MGIVLQINDSTQLELQSREIVTLTPSQIKSAWFYIMYSINECEWTTLAQFYSFISWVPYKTSQCPLV